MRIGIFTDTYTPDINGVVSSVLTLQKGLEEAGHEVFIVTGQKGILKSYREGNVLRMPGLELKKLYGYTLSTPFDFAIKSELEKLNLDIIHVQQEFTVGMFGRLMARTLRVPMVYTYHTMYEDYTHYINKFELESVEKVSKMAVYQMSKYLCNSVSGIIAPSSKTKEKLESYGVVRPIYIIPTGLELDRFKKENIEEKKLDEIRNKYQLDPNKKLITYLGRVANEKSIDMIIDAIAHVKNENCHFMIVGGGPSLEDLKNQAKQLGVADKVIFTGAVSREEVPLYYQVSDVFVSASTSETQGITYIEALASDLCVLARPDEVLDQLIEDGKNGFYFDSALELAEKIDVYLDLSQDVKEEMRICARKTAERYDVKKMVRDMLTVYQVAITDYEDCYTIKRIVASNDCMKLYLYNPKYKIEETLLMSLDDYTLHRLKKEDIIEMYVYDALKKRENILLARRMCIRKLCAKDYTRKEMYDFLINQDKYPLDIKDINELIEQLEDRGFINDEAYASIQVDKMDLALIGKRTILRKLVQKGLPVELVEKHLVSLDDENEKAKCEKAAAKHAIAIHNKSLREKKNILMGKLRRDGYPNEIVTEVVSNMNIEEDLLQERVILLKTLEKAKKNYGRKYKGAMLKERIIRYALGKGFLYDDIVQALKEESGDE